MAVIEDDTKIYPVLAELSACLCAQLSTDTPCFCGIIVGNDVPVEYAGLCEDSDGCEVAYVRLINAYPSIDFPEVDTVANCTTLMAYTVAVGIVRCWEYGVDGNPPEPEQVAELSRTLLSDMAKIRRTIQCCFGDKFDDIEYIVGAYTPLPSTEGIAGGEQIVTIQERF